MSSTKSTGDKKPNHFTYAEPGTGDLCQGDLLEKSAEIRRILKIVHPHYLDDDYSHFLILTQSCDLVRRGPANKRQCGARYITLAPVRPLTLVVTREVETFQSALANKANVCSKEHKLELKRFLQRLLNNNNPDYFYLHEEPEYGLFESACAFLRLSISLRAYQHYEACLNARKVSLEDVFQAKLGWLVGNAFSRVGTPDWTNHYSRKRFDKIVKDILDKLCQWVDDRKLTKAQETAPADITDWEQMDIRQYIENAPLIPRRERVLDCVSEVLRGQGFITDEEDLARMRLILSKQSEFLANVPE